MAAKQYSNTAVTLLDLQGDGLQGHCVVFINKTLYPIRIPGSLSLMADFSKPLASSAE